MLLRPCSMLTLILEVPSGVLLSHILHKADGLLGFLPSTLNVVLKRDPQLRAAYACNLILAVAIIAPKRRSARDGFSGHIGFGLERPLPQEDFDSRFAKSPRHISNSSTKIMHAGSIEKTQPNTNPTCSGTKPGSTRKLTFTGF